MKFKKSPQVACIALSLSLSFLGSGGRAEDLGGLAATSGPVPPEQAAAEILPEAGRCLQFISVFVPVQGGNYVVGVSFAYQDRDSDGAYSPGTDRLDVCVNCMDACDWGP